MTRKLKVGVVGTGYFSQFHFDAWARCEEVELVGVASLNLESASKIAASYGGKVFKNAATMCEATQPDLLDVIVPPSQHEAIITLAAEFGIDVVCQKPFCGDLETAIKMTKLADAADIKLTVHENFRFQPWYRKIKSVLESGMLGQVYQSTFRFRPGDGRGDDAYLERQPYFQEMERFLVHETGVHYLDVFRFLFGEVDTIWADLRRLNPVIAGEDSCHIVMSHGRVQTILDGNRLADHQAENRRVTMGELQIDAENGALSLSGDGEITFRKTGSNDIEAIDYKWRNHGFGGDCVFNFTRHVVDHYVSGTPLENSAKDYVANLHLVEAVYASAQDGCRKELA